VAVQEKCMKTKGSSKQSAAAKVEGDEASPLTPAAQAHIGRYLRHLYDAVAQEPVPDRFVQLLQELERKSAVRK
jgi:hypothetical protein